MEEELIEQSKQHRERQEKNQSEERATVAEQTARREQEGWVLFLRVHSVQILEIK